MSSSFGLNIVDDSDDLFPPPLPLDDDDDVALRTSSRTRRRSAPSSSSSDPVQAAPDRSPDQAVQRETKKRRLNEAHDERLRLIDLREREQEATRVTIEVPELDPRDDKPPEQTLVLMRHTLASLKKAANPQVLELRILTLHHSDDRFAFLRTDGRYRTAWERLKSGHVGDQASKSVATGLGGLMGAYGDSDSGSDDDGALPPMPASPPPPSPPRTPPPLPEE